MAHIIFTVLTIISLYFLRYSKSKWETSILLLFAISVAASWFVSKEQMPYAFSLFLLGLAVACLYSLVKLKNEIKWILALSSSLVFCTFLFKMQAWPNVHILSICMIAPAIAATIQFFKGLKNPSAISGIFLMIATEAWMLFVPVLLASL